MLFCDLLCTQSCCPLAHALLVTPQVGKQEEIEAAGHDPHALSQYGILLDTDMYTGTDKLITDGQRYDTITTVTDETLPLVL